MAYLGDLSLRQQRAAAAICLGVIILVLVGLIVLGTSIVTGTLTGDRGPGHGLMLLMDNSTVLVAGKSIPLILSIGAAALAQSKLRDGIFYAIIALCVTGVVLSLAYIVVLSAPSVADEMFNNAPTEALATSERYLAAVSRFFVPLTVWLVGMLAIQLGIKLDTAAPGAAPPPIPAPQPTPAPGEAV